LNFAVWRALAGVLTGAICRNICCQRAREKFAAGNAFVSGDGRSSRWCTVEVSSQRLWCKSVMSVREKCDEKVGRNAVAVHPRLAPKKRARTWGTGPPRMLETHSVCFRIGQRRCKEPLELSLCLYSDVPSLSSERVSVGRFRVARHSGAECWLVSA